MSADEVWCGYSRLRRDGNVERDVVEREVCAWEERVLDFVRGQRQVPNASHTAPVLQLFLLEAVARPLRRIAESGHADGGPPRAGQTWPECGPAVDRVRGAHKPSVPHSAMRGCRAPARTGVRIVSE